MAILQLLAVAESSVFLSLCTNERNVYIYMGHCYVAQALK